MQSAAATYLTGNHTEISQMVADIPQEEDIPQESEPMEKEPEEEQEKEDLQEDDD